MATFLNSNSGLASRFPNVFNFADYSHEHLAEILASTAEDKGFALDAALDAPSRLALVKRCIKPAEIPKGNGRVVRNLVEASSARSHRHVVQ